MSKCFIGIDAGVHGAIVALYEGDVMKFPLSHKPSSKAKGMGKSRREIAEHLQWLNSDDGVVVCIEDPGMAIFRIRKQDLALLNRSFAELRMACEILYGEPPREVTPKEWIRWLGIPARKPGETTGHWKKRLADVARKLFPGVTVTADCADALLIAHYCRETSK